MTGLNFAPAVIEREDLPGGAFILRSPVALNPYPDTLNEHLYRWAEETPGRPFIAQRNSTGAWRKVNYKATLQHARAIAQALLNRKIPTDRPLMIISENSIDHALLMLGALLAGVPVSPISPPYALMSTDHGKLKHIFDILNPALLYVPDGDKYAAALGALDLNDVELVVSSNPPDGIYATRFETLCQTSPTPYVERASASLTPNSIAKILFTSGSTGMPKGVINTHRMLCSNQQALAQVWPFIEEKPPVLLDWLPWSHTFGANHNFNLILRNGGTLYIDAGKPTPDLVATTIANLRDVAPTLYFNVPRGYDQIIPALEADTDLRDHFFSRLDTVFYAAADLPQNLWTRMEKLSLEARGRKIAMTSAWGSTETAPLATSVHFEINRAGVLGLPIPETEIKMVPNAGKLEIRVRGPNVMPGYYKSPDMTKAAFDEDGFYRIGDAVKLADPNDPTRGVIFDGRVAEDFKLLTGSWASVSTVRMAIISACDPMVQDAVVTGHDRDEIGLLIFPNMETLKQVADIAIEIPTTDLIDHPKVRTALANAVATYNTAHPASSQRVARLLVMHQPPQIDRNEITDKGYINQRAVLENRAHLIEKLYSDDPAVIIIE
jgi:feruloyl-CoA synthase